MKLPLRDPGELRLLEWLRGACSSVCDPSLAQHVEVDIGDDMAILRLDSGQVILAGTDMMIAGTHFDPQIHTASQIGRKAAAAGLSDCAAMAVKPLAMLTSVALPKHEIFGTGKELLASMIETAGAFDCPLIGGDTIGASDAFAVDVLVLAEPWSDVSPIRRSTARPGDLVYVTGTLGGSILGKHLAFTPRVREARELSRLLCGSLHALIDISDGLALDLFRICSASDCGAILDEDLLAAAASEAAVTLAEQDGRPVLDHVLGDGEDFELLLAIGPEALALFGHAGTEGDRLGVLPCPEIGLELRPLGRITAKGLKLRQRDSTLIDLSPEGFSH